MCENNNPINGCSKVIKSDYSLKKENQSWGIESKNKTKELYEVYKNGGKGINSYISKDGRYIMLQ